MDAGMSKYVNRLSIIYDLAASADYTYAITLSTKFRRSVDKDLSHRCTFSLHMDMLTPVN